MTDYSALITLPEHCLVFRGMQYDKTHQALSNQFHTQVDNEYLYKDPTLPPNKDIFLLSPKDTTTPLFVLPTIFNHDVSQSKEMTALAIDTRGCSRLDRAGEVVVSNRTEYLFALTTGVLTYNRWKHGVVFNDLGYMMKVWTMWISGQLIQRLNIEFGFQPNVTVITALYFWFLNQPNPNEIDLSDVPTQIQLSKVISNAVNINSTTVIELIKDVKPFWDLDGFCEALKNMGSTRFNNITPAFFFSAFQYSWYGAGAIQIVGVALEYPPVFASMMYNAATNDGYSKTLIGKTMKATSRNDGDLFVKTMNKLLNSEE